MKLAKSVDSEKITCQYCGYTQMIKADKDKFMCVGVCEKCGRYYSIVNKAYRLKTNQLTRKNALKNDS